MRDLKITNPDEPASDVYIKMLVPSVPGQSDSPRVEKALAPVLLAKCPYAGGIFFDYLQWWFMAVAQDAGGHWAPVMGADGRPEMYAERTHLMSQYLALVSSNFVYKEIFSSSRTRYSRRTSF